MLIEVSAVVRALTPTNSPILYAGSIFLLLLHVLSARPVEAQNGLFRTPSLKGSIHELSPSPAITSPGNHSQQKFSTIGLSRTAQLSGRSADGLSPHLPSHNLNDLGIKQTGQQDPINDWLNEKEQEPLPGSEEELPAGDSKSIEDGNVDGSNREVIVQRYSDGKPQIEREVMQDEEGNYVNDGFWRVYSQQGERVILAQGQYRNGVMEGTWMRKHAKNSSGLFSTKPFSMFEGPFVSIATFKNSKLDGLWTLLDSTNQKMFEVPYKEGKRHGTASWWYPSLTKMREVTFVDGVISGTLREWDEQKKLVRDEEYLKGQRLIRNVTYYRPQQIETENYFLEAKLELEGEDDWWRAVPARMVTKGSRVQHGPVAFWYENGMPKLKGNYDQGNPVGRFTGWHASGNKRMEGSFEKGKKEGLWRWWHSNGNKATEGNYKDDRPIGAWTWWNEQGEVEDKKQFDEEPSANVSREESAPSSTTDPEQLPDGLPGLEPNVTPAQANDPQNVFDLDLDGLDPQQPANKQQPENSAPVLTPATDEPGLKPATDESGGDNQGTKPTATSVVNPILLPTTTTDDQANPVVQANQPQAIPFQADSFDELMESYGKQ